MLETIGSKEVVVRDYTSNFDVKEFIQEVLIPQAFPDIPMNKLNLGFSGVVSEYIGQAIEDSAATASLMMNESFITRAVLPESIYSKAAIYELGYAFANPSKCNFALELSLSDVIEYSTKVSNSSAMRYKLDRDTAIVLGDNTYRLDYDVFIDHQMIDGKRIFNVYYNIEEENSISDITTKYIKHQVTTIDWLVLFMDLKEFERKTDEVSITDNLITTNSPIEIGWTGQIAGLDLVYIDPQGNRTVMKKKTKYTQPDVDPFAWYTFTDDYKIELSFTSNEGYWTPDFNSKIEYTIYTCRGASANFTSYDRKSGVPVEKTAERYSYNADTKMVALCYTGSYNGTDKGDIEDLRTQVILAMNNSDVLITAYDLELYFYQYAQRNGSIAKFFKRRDDPSGRLFSQFIAIINDTYIYPTNTLTIDVDQDQFDFVNSDLLGNNQEFVIKPGHLWEYAGHFLGESSFNINDERHLIMSTYKDDPNIVFHMDDENNLFVVLPDDADYSFSVDENGHLIVTYDSLVRDRLRMVESADQPAMISDESLPGVTTERPFIFVNPFFIKIYRDPTVSMNYNCLINDTSWPEDVPVNTGCFYQFQLATFSVQRTLSPTYPNMYHLEIICVPTVTTDTSLKYIEGVGEDYPVENNNMRLVLVTRTDADGETGYIEMTPTEERSAGSYLFSADIAVYDNLNSDMTLEVDLDRTPGMNSLIMFGDNEGKVLMDSQEASFHFIVMMKDFTGKLQTGLYNDPTYEGYVMANRFANDKRSLTLYKPLSMMRSYIKFNGENNDFNIQASLMPMLRYDIPLDDEKMEYFIEAFDEQYDAMEDVLSKLDGNLDFKLYNTYGRSNNYYIGPEEDGDVLSNSELLLDNVYVTMKLVLSVYDRSLYTQTASDVKNEIISFFNTLNDGTRTDIHLSNILHNIECNHPNVKYVRFLGFNDYNATKESIFLKYSSESELSQDDIQVHVPEMIRVDTDSIEITEET